LLSPEERQRGADRELDLEEIVATLVSDALLSEHQAERLRFVARQADDSPQHPLVTISEQGLTSAADPRIKLDLEHLTRWLADKVGLPYVRIDPLRVDVHAVTGVVKRAYAERFNILPLEVKGERVTVATCEPFVREWQSELGRTARLELEPVIANPQSIRRYRAEFYAVSRSLVGAERDARSAPISASGDLEQLVELGRRGELDANDRHVVSIVDWLLQYAFEQRASDIHLEPRREQGNMRFRIDGVLHLVHQIPAPVLAAVTSRLKALGRLDVVERRRPQDGRLKTKSPGGREVEMRLSTMPTTFGEKLVLRIFDPDVLVRSFADLGFSDRDEEHWQAMVSRPHGMVVVTGPTGSGKTTTLYSALKRLARPELNVCTIEDPIELVDPQLNQMYVQHGIGLDFATGVRTLLRQDPDIIMVGEIRDQETAEAAIQAALTGHLVLTTLHTNDAPSSVTRFLDLGVPPYLLKTSLLGVVAQRLVRTLCPHCKAPRPIATDVWEALAAPARMAPPPEVQGATGCDECRHTGFLGRSGIYEILLMSKALR
jgi:general secretion pathway protein E